MGGNMDSYLIEGVFFGIEDTLTSGQCFRFEKLADEEYSLIAYSKKIILKCEPKGVTLYNTGAKEYEQIWKVYFDINTDYEKICKTLVFDDTVMQDAVNFAPGIRILRQEPWECLISFIISQNNNIPRIKKIIEKISMRFGTDMGGYYAFPTPEQLAGATLDDLKECGTGFRAKYIFDAINRVVHGGLDFAALDKLPTDELRVELMKIYGVGRKVSDCVMLFSFGRTELFPVDVWIKRIMEYFYFSGGDTSIDKIHEFAAKKFQSYGGYAQQFLFHYARNLAVFKK